MGKIRSLPYSSLNMNIIFYIQAQVVKIEGLEKKTKTYGEKKFNLNK